MLGYLRYYAASSIRWSQCIVTLIREDTRQFVQRDKVLCNTHEVSTHIHTRIMLFGFIFTSVISILKRSVFSLLINHNSDAENFLRFLNDYNDESRIFSCWFYFKKKLLFLYFSCSLLTLLGRYIRFSHLKLANGSFPIHKIENASQKSAGPQNWQRVLLCFWVPVYLSSYLPNKLVSRRELLCW